jgi:cysteinyl-tRNA synthetase
LLTTLGMNVRALLGLVGTCSVLLACSDEPQSLKRRNGAVAGVGVAPGQGEQAQSDEEASAEQAGSAPVSDGAGAPVSTGSGTGAQPAPAGTGTQPTPAGGRGVDVPGPWVSFYGPAAGVNLGKVASSFRFINIDADPGTGNYTPAQIATLKAQGKNRVVSYLNLGSCESFRTYYAQAPAGLASCVSSGALTTNYDGYPDEKWANLSNAAYRKLMVDHVAARLMAQGVDGFYLDNLEVVEHGAGNSNGPCDAKCAQGGLDLVFELRAKFPNAVIIMQNATSDVTRLGQTHGVAFRSLLDGISHEEVYGPGGDASVRSELLAWKGSSLGSAQKPFWISTEDYVGACNASKKSAALSILQKASNDGIKGYVTDESGGQTTPCHWDDF